MNDPNRAEATAGSRAYVSEVQQLVDEQTEILCRLMTAAAARVSTGAQHIDVTRQAHSLTASVCERATDFRIEAITDQPEDLRTAPVFMTCQARCILPTPDGATDEWVLALQAGGAGYAGARHSWMYVRTEQPVSEAAVATLLRSCFP